MSLAMVRKSWVVLVIGGLLVTCGYLLSTTSYVKNFQATQTSYKHRDMEAKSPPATLDTDPGHSKTTDVSERFRRRLDTLRQACKAFFSLSTSDLDVDCVLDLVVVVFFNFVTCLPYYLYTGAVGVVHNIRYSRASTFPESRLLRLAAGFFRLFVGGG